MVVYFLADIHLSEHEPEITTAFTQTLSTLARHRPEGVFILGDLFDYYLGDELITPFQRQIAQQLKTLASQTPVFYQHGNRDFLIKEHFANLSGMTLLPERYCLTLGEDRLLLEHGDLLCTDDIGYQRLRKVLRHRFTYWLYQKASSSFKVQIAKYLRRQSKRRGREKPLHITDTNPETIEKIMRHFNVQILIHGHTHRPKVQTMANGTCFVLGDWHPHGMILKYDQEKFFLLNSHDLVHKQPPL